MDGRNDHRGRFLGNQLPAPCRGGAGVGSLRACGTLILEESPSARNLSKSVQNQTKSGRSPGRDFLYLGALTGGNYSKIKFEN